MNKKTIINKLVEHRLNRPSLCRAKLIKLTTRFASYLKYKERGKKDKKAIASAGMILKMFLYTIEEFHLELAKELPGSTISTGAEKMKKKESQNH